MTRASDTAKLLGAGATILDGTTISTADNTEQLTLTSTDADANAGPEILLDRNSSSPADSDRVGKFTFKGRNDANQTVEYGNIQSRITDASDGTEDGRIIIQNIIAGDVAGVMESDGTETIFNNNSKDLDFRVESNGDANMLFVDGGTDTVIVGHNVSRTTMFNSTVGGSLQVEGTTAEGATVSIARNSNDDNGPNLVFAKSNSTSNAGVTVVTDDALLGRISWQGADGSQTVEAARIEGFVDSTPGANDMPGRLTFSTTADGAATVTERARLTSDGVFMVGQTSFAYGDVGCSMTSSGQVGGTADGDVAGIFNRKTSDGQIINLRQDNTTIGGIYSSPSIAGPFIGHINVGLAMYHAGNSVLPSGTGGLRDNAIDLGNSSNRFDDIFATNSTINTSDRNEKQDIEELSEAEQRVAVVAKGLMRKFRWKSAVAEKGDDARTHFGIIAQDLQDAFTAEGLDASDYAMFTSNTWWEKEISVDAVEADEENGIEAQEAYTYTKIAEEETEGYTEKTRLGVRYSELLAFIISAI